jgi:hypothetical protein
VIEITIQHGKTRFGNLGAPELNELRQLREKTGGRRDSDGPGSGSLDLAGGAQKKMVRPATRRAMVRRAEEGYRVSERRAIPGVGMEPLGGALPERAAAPVGAP